MLLRVAEVGPHAGAGAHEHEPRHVLRVGRQVVLREKAAVGEADHHPAIDPEGGAQRVEIGDRLLHGVALLAGLVVRQAGSALVVVDDPGVLGRPPEPRVEVVVGAPGSAVDQDHGDARPLLLHVELGAADVDAMHGQLQPLLQAGNGGDLRADTVLEVNDAVKHGLPVRRCARGKRHDEEWNQPQSSMEMSTHGLIESDARCRGKVWIGTIWDRLRLEPVFKGVAR